MLTLIIIKVKLITNKIYLIWLNATATSVAEIPPIDASIGGK